jgi:hypothetical protein
MSWRWGGTPAQILALSESRSRYLEASESKRKDSAAKVADSIGEQSSATFRMRGFGDYTPDDKASTMKRRDYLDATDLVVRQE